MCLVRSSLIIRIAYTILRIVVYIFIVVVYSLRTHLMLIFHSVLQVWNHMLIVNSRSVPPTFNKYKNMLKNLERSVVSSTSYIESWSMVDAEPWSNDFHWKYNYLKGVPILGLFNACVSASSRTVVYYIMLFTKLSLSVLHSREILFRIVFVMLQKWLWDGGG